jgi:electron transfer flavoprotein alpha subunit
MSSILVIAEVTAGQLAQSTSRAVSCAAAVPESNVDVLVVAPESESPALQAAEISGVGKVIRIDAADEKQTLAPAMAAEIAAMSDGYSHILGPASTFGKDLMPRVAALIDAPQVSEIMTVRSERSFERLIFAGDALETVEVSASTIVGTVRLPSFAPAPAAQAPAPIETRDAASSAPEHTRLVERSEPVTDRPDLQTATRVVSGGRAFGSEEKFAALYRLADKIGAAVGASRAAVDSGYVQNELQVGQTGKKIAPELYMAFGISGAIQHIAGIKDSGLIVAVNKDPEAAIFDVADVGLVGDIFEIIPELMDLLD